MRLISLTLSNFGSWRGEHTVDFYNRPAGLHLIRGRNEVEPRLGSNGAGKTTLINAWRWCWYGKTARGVGAGNIRSWDGKGTTEVVALTKIRGRRIGVRRTQGPNSLRLYIDKSEVVDATQDDVDRELGIAEDLFDHSLTVPQFHTFFFDLQPAPKLALFSQLLDLDFWTERSKHAARTASAHDDKVKAAHGTISRIEALIETHASSIVRLRERADAFEDETEEAIRDRKGELRDLADKIVAQRKVVARSKAKADTARVNKDSASKRRTEQLTAERGARDWVAETHTAMTRANDRRDAAEAMREKLSDDECPVCGQKITEQHRRTEESRIRKEIAAVDRELEDLGVRLTAAKAALEAAKLPEDDGKDSDDDTIIDAAADQRDLDNLLKDERTTKQRIEVLKTATNPHDAELDTIKKALKDEKLDLADAVRDHDRLQVETAAKEYWIKGFKEIRLSLIDDALDAFEVETNNALSQIGLLDWSLEFDIERETKSGTVSKGFTVNVLPPNRKDSVPWACWSGGETQRLRAAGTFGLSALILAQCGIDSQIEIYDEPCQHLSPEGIDDLLSLLAHRARTLDKQIWLIEHRALAFGDFASVLTIVKDDTGSHVEEASASRPERRRIKEK